MSEKLFTAVPDIKGDKKQHVNLKTCSIRKLGALWADDRDNQELFSEIFRRIVLGIKTYLSGYCKDKNDIINQEEIDEVTNITFGKAWEKRHMFDNSKGEVSTWLYRIARNIELSRIQSREEDPVIKWDINEVYSSYLYGEDGMTGPVDVSRDEYIVDNDGNLISCHYKDVIQRFHDVSVAAMDMLPENYRSIVKCKLLQSKKIQDIAVEYHLNVSTVKNWLYNGKRELSKYLMEHHKDLYDMYIDALAEQNNN